MLAIRTKGRMLRSDKRGATVIEYGLIVSLIVVAIMASLAALGGGANGMWGKLDNEVAAAM